MIYIKPFPYQPNESEAEKASSSYLMSIVALVMGLPFPIVNLIATLIFYLGNQKASYFVRWHSTQTLLSQLFLFFINSIGIWWSIYVFILMKEDMSKAYIIYICFLLLLNVIEFIITIYTAIQTRKGIHVEWFGYNQLTNALCKPEIKK